MKTIFALTVAALMAAGAMAQSNQALASYNITDLGTMGGTYSRSYGINNLGVVAGGAATTVQKDGLSQTAILWYAGSRLSMGTLDGPACPFCNASMSAVSINVSGGANASTAVMGSEISTFDPNGEDFCYYGTHRQCITATWANVSTHVLPMWPGGTSTTVHPMLPGGNNAQAYSINKMGQTIGVSENGIRDSTCAQATPFQALRFAAVIWAPGSNIVVLPPLDGDTVAFGSSINDSGQAVGGSGTCDNTSPPSKLSAPHAVLWDTDGTVHDLGNLGGRLSIATGINNKGQVIGDSSTSIAGGLHPFLWTKQNGIQDLGLLATDTMTVVPCCNSLNNNGQVVGFSCPGPQGSCRAFLWQNNVMTDLNTLLPAGSPWYLQSANSINDLGQIVGRGLIGGEIHAFLATPQ